MKNIVGIAEIVLWTADQPRALAFYRDLLGLEVISRPGMANVFLKVGEGNAGIPQMIVLVPKPEEIKGRPSGYQLHHLALELPDDQFEQQPTRWWRPATRRAAARTRCWPAAPCTWTTPTATRLSSSAAPRPNKNQS